MLDRRRFDSPDPLGRTEVPKGVQPIEIKEDTDLGLFLERIRKGENTRMAFVEATESIPEKSKVIIDNPSLLVKALRENNSLVYQSEEIIGYMRQFGIKNEIHLRNTRTIIVTEELAKIGYEVKIDRATLNSFLKTVFDSMLKNV